MNQFDFSLAMIKTAGLITALCLATSFAEKLNFFSKEQINATNDGPYPHNCTYNVSDTDTLLDAMEKAKTDAKCKWTYVMSSLFYHQHFSKTYSY